MLLKVLFFLRFLNWTAVSSLLAAIAAVVVAFISTNSIAPAISLTGLSISLALLALSD